jgi:hypothetical protein
MFGTGLTLSSADFREDLFANVFGMNFVKRKRDAILCPPANHNRPLASWCSSLPIRASDRHARLTHRSERKTNPVYHASPKIGAIVRE